MLFWKRSLWARGDFYHGEKRNPLFRREYDHVISLALVIGEEGKDGSLGLYFLREKSPNRSAQLLSLRRGCGLC